MDARTWAEEQFGQCELKDKRRTDRLVDLAASVLSHPAGSLPEQMGNMADLKAAYRLFACEDVSFDAIAEPHWRQTRQQPPGTYLLLDDTTELDFGIRRQIAGMGRTGNGGGWGFLLHSALMVSAQSEEILGLAGQKIRYRTSLPEKENTTQRLQRDRESELWGQVIDLVGSPPEGSRLVHVMDRGADNFEVYQHCRQQSVDWVVRVTQRARNVIVPSGKTRALNEYLETLPLSGSYELKMRARGRSREHGPEPANGPNGGSLWTAEDAVSQAQEPLSEALRTRADSDVGDSCGRSESSGGRGTDRMDTTHFHVRGELRGRLADHGLLRETVAHRGVAQSAEDRLPCGVPAVEMQGRFGENHRIAERRGRKATATEIGGSNESRPTGATDRPDALDTDARCRASG